MRVSPGDIARAYGLEVEPWVPPRYNIAPTEEVGAVVAEGQAGQEAEDRRQKAAGDRRQETEDRRQEKENKDAQKRVWRVFRWGLIPEWAKDPAIGQKMINARGETVLEKAAFREAFRQRRCLVPALGFFEWLKEGRQRVPYFIRGREEELLSFAGLWETWRDPSGRIIPTCTIITTPANELVALLHDRMPAIIRPEHFAWWLEAPAGQAGELRELLKPYPAERLRAKRVNPGVNRPGVEDPSFID